MNWMFKVVPAFIVFTFVLIIAWYFLVGTLAVKAVGEIKKSGLKSIVEEIWEGAPKAK